MKEKDENNKNLEKEYNLNKEKSSKYIKELEDSKQKLEKEINENKDTINKLKDEASQAKVALANINIKSLPSIFIYYIKVTKWYLFITDNLILFMTFS